MHRRGAGEVNYQQMPRSGVLARFRHDVRLQPPQQRLATVYCVLVHGVRTVLTKISRRARLYKLLYKPMAKAVGKSKFRPPHIADTT